MELLSELQEQHVACMDRQPSLYAHVMLCPHTPSQGKQTRLHRAGEDFKQAAHMLVGVEPLIKEQTWPLKAKGKLQTCGHLWLPGLCPGVFWLQRQYRELRETARPPPCEQVQWQQPQEPGRTDALWGRAEIGG